MKVIFLDIDGVLNSSDWYTRRFDMLEMKQIADEYPHYEFDRDLVKNLNKIIDETGAKVVVSSTWRMRRTIEELQEILNSVGFTGEVIGKTDIFRGIKNNDSIPSYNIPRGCEIEHWLYQHGKFQRINWSKEEQLICIEKAIVKNYIILDDDSDMLYGQREHFVHTPNSDGLTIDKARLAIKILNTPLEKLYYSNELSDT